MNEETEVTESNDKPGVPVFGVVCIFMVFSLLFCTILFVLNESGLYQLVDKVYQSESRKAEIERIDDILINWQTHPKNYYFEFMHRTGAYVVGDIGQAGVFINRNYVSFYKNVSPDLHYNERQQEYIKSKLDRYEELRRSKAERDLKKALIRPGPMIEDISVYRQQWAKKGDTVIFRFPGKLQRIEPAK